jgi:hypothetical protein
MISLSMRNCPLILLTFGVLAMNRVTDIVIATQLCTAIAALFTFLAHLIENGTILNPNWMFAVYVLMFFACLFMLFPHIIASKVYESITDDCEAKEDTYQVHMLELRAQEYADHNSGREWSDRIPF